MSLFEEGCIEKGLSYSEGGPVYNVISPHIGGLPDTINSLYAIKKLVFDDKLVDFKVFMDIFGFKYTLLYLFYIYLIYSIPCSLLSFELIF